MYKIQQLIINLYWSACDPQIVDRYSMSSL